MRVATKINAALFCAFACGTFATYAVLHSTIQPRFEEIERTDAQMNHKRVNEAVYASMEKLETATQDYAFWDSTFDAMHGTGVEDFITSNLTPGLKAVENLGINALVFQRADGGLMWGGAVDLETQEPIEGLVEEITQFVHNNRVIDRLSNVTHRGMIRTSKGLMLLAITPVLKSDRTGEPAGKVMAAKLFDPDTIKSVTGVDFKVEELPPDIVDAKAPSVVELTVFSDHISTVSVANSVIGEPLVYFKVSSSREVTRTGSNAIRSATIMMVIAALAAMGVLWAFLRLAVVARVSALKTHFATAGSSGRIQQTDAGMGDDEISDLARSFNMMADQVNHLRDALADSAYMSGLSEWAAGTLHNVRNGLVPVASTTWQVQQLFEGSWLKNVEVAAAEYADSATAPERRAKLNAFLVGSASRLAASANETLKLTGQINGASRSVIDMVSEFERYAHRKTELEALDLLPLVQSVAGTTIAPRAKDTEVIFPQGSVTVHGNGIILRQVLSNILINALESIEKQDRRGRIEISIAESSTRDGITTLSITDNGVGVPEHSLSAIFHRGVSTRSQRPGGLGLHWCANAVKVLGGTIRAESKGPGLGATILIDLPNYDMSKKEAA